MFFIKKVYANTSSKGDSAASRAGAMSAQSRGLHPQQQAGNFRMGGAVTGGR